MTPTSIPPLRLADAGRLLDPDPMPLEMGVEWLEQDVLHVASRTDMPRCTGEMFEWWFRFAPDTQQYAWWHPLDHVSSSWVETSPRTHIGSTHVVTERLGGDQVLEISINFCDPTEIFDERELTDARASGHVSGVVYARSAIGTHPTRDALGRPRQTRMVHLARDTPEGLVLRSHWWLDHDREPDEPTRAGVQAGLGLVRHSNTEFKYLSHFLPSLFIAENREDRVPPDLW